MRIYGLQLDIAWENRDRNHARVLELLEAAPPEPGALLALPEMFASGFSMNVASISDSARRESAMFLAAVASKYKLTVIGGVVNDGADGRGRNEALAFGHDGREIARYTKLHPFSLGTEDQHYEAGTQVTVFEWQGFQTAPLICYDLRFPEAFRAAQKQGAELFVVIASWPEARTNHWIALLRARAIENQAYVVGVNRCGSDPKFSYSGHSMIVDQHGEVLVDAGSEQTLFSAAIDRAAFDKYRSDLPFLADRRGDL
jgi:predicted amidohydrolase